MKKTTYQVVYLHEYVNNRTDFQGTDDEYHSFFLKNYIKELIDNYPIDFEHPIDKKTVWLVVNKDSQHIQVPKYFQYVLFFQYMFLKTEVPDMVIDWNIIHDNVLGIFIKMDLRVIKKNPIQIPDKYPSQLKYLTIFICEETLKIGQLPNTLTSLCLIMLDTVNGFIEEGAIPESVEKLFINMINQPITKDLLPKNLKNFNYEWCSENLTPGSLPDSLEYFEYPENETEYEPGILPEKLKHLKIGCIFLVLIKNPQFLPIYLEKLEIHFENLEEFEEHFEDEIDYEFIFTPGLLPPHLKRLKIESLDTCDDYITYRFEPGSLPEGLTHLQVDKTYDFKFEEGVLPSTLKVLLLGYYYDQIPDIHLLPPSLKYICNQYNVDENSHDNLAFMKSLFDLIEMLNKKTHLNLYLINNFKKLMMIKMNIDSHEPPKKKRIYTPKKNIVDTILTNPLIHQKIYNYLKPERELIYHDLCGIRPQTKDIQFQYSFHANMKKAILFIEEDENEDQSE